MKRTRHVAAAAKGLHTFEGFLAVDEDFDVDILLYGLFSERLCVANLSSFTEEDLDPWHGQYLVHGDALCWGRTIIK